MSLGPNVPFSAWLNCQAGMARVVSFARFRTGRVLLTPGDGKYHLGGTDGHVLVAKEGISQLRRGQPGVKTTHEIGNRPAQTLTKRDGSSSCLHPCSSDTAGLFGRR